MNLLMMAVFVAYVVFEHMSSSAKRENPYVSLARGISLEYTTSLAHGLSLEYTSSLVEYHSDTRSNILEHQHSNTNARTQVLRHDLCSTPLYGSHHDDVKESMQIFSKYVLVLPSIVFFYMIPEVVLTFVSHHICGEPETHSFRESCETFHGYSQTLASVVNC